MVASSAPTSPSSPGYESLYALAVQARHALITRLLELLADASDDHRRHLTLLLRATSFPILAARQSTARPTAPAPRPTHLYAAHRPPEAAVSRRRW